MDNARLSPDGHTVAFASPVGGVAQVFLMLTSGGEPLQLTNDEGDKFVDTFFARRQRNLLPEGYRPRRNLGRAHTRRQSSPGGICQLCGSLSGWRLQFIMRSLTAPEFFVRENPD